MNKLRTWGEIDSHIAEIVPEWAEYGMSLRDFAVFLAPKHESGTSSWPAIQLLLYAAFTCYYVRTESVEGAAERMLAEMELILYGPDAKPDYAAERLNPKWQKLRLKVMDRGNFTCTKCGTTERTLHVHHVKYVYGRRMWEYPLEMLATLCKDCHAELHDKATKGAD